MMLNFQQFLTEEVSEKDLAKFIKHVNSKCNQFLMASKGQFIYRGLENTPEVFFKKNIRTNRKPKDMDSDVSTRLDTAFNTVFGLKPRSAALFVIGDKMNATMYGDPYVVFPIGKIQYIWSPRIDDLFAKVYAREYEKLDSIKLKAWVKEHYVKNKDLVKAIKSGSEICIFAKSYCGISADYYRKLIGGIK